MRKQTEAIRRIERGEIERWFSSDAFGAFFHAADGRAWPIDDARAARGRARAFAAVDAMLAASRRQTLLLIAVAVVASLAMPYLVEPALRGVAAGAIVVALFGGTALGSVVRLALYRRQLRRLRLEIAGTVTGPPLEPADPARPARTNMFRVGQHLWVLLCLIGVIVVQLLPGGVPGQLQTAGGDETLLAVALGLGPAWALYFAAEQVDRVQARPRERLSRLP